MGAWSVVGVSAGWQTEAPLRLLGVRARRELNIFGYRMMTHAPGPRAVLPRSDLNGNSCRRSMCRAIEFRQCEIINKCRVPGPLPALIECRSDCDGLRLGLEALREQHPLAFG